MEQPAKLDVPEVYVDQFSFSVSPFTASLLVGVQEISPATSAQPQQLRWLQIVRMSPGHAKLMAMLMRKTLKENERGSETTIAIPSKVMSQLGLAPEDW